MRVVAIGALDQAFVHAVVKGHAELRLLLKVTAIAKLRRRFYQQELRSLCMMRRMAGDTTDVTLGMQGIDSLHVFGAGRVTAEAAVIDLLGRMLLEDEYLCGIATAGNVICPGAMAAFAPLV